MTKITQIPIPNTSIFEPVTSVYENNLTYVEFLLGILKKLNETVAQVNKNSEFIEDYDGRIETVEKEIAQLRVDLEEGIARQDAEIEARFTQIESTLRTMVSVALDESKAYSDTLYRILDSKIDQVAVGQINVYDPTTGEISPLQDVLNNLAGSTKNALTASEYDALALTATVYDDKDITAFNYDYNGKAILMV